MERLQTLLQPKNQQPFCSPDQFGQNSKGTRKSTRPRKTRTIYYVARHVAVETERFKISNHLIKEESCNQSYKRQSFQNSGETKKTSFLNMAKSWVLHSSIRSFHRRKIGQSRNQFIQPGTSSAKNFRFFQFSLIKIFLLVWLATTVTKQSNFFVIAQSPPPSPSPTDTMTPAPSSAVTVTVDPPFVGPSASPTSSLSPTATISSHPTVAPSPTPTQQDTSLEPTNFPSMSTSPSSLPTFSPSHQPSASLQPSFPPSVIPSNIPSFEPSTAPSTNPTLSSSPSSAPTSSPSTSPSEHPSLQPSMGPSSAPTLTMIEETQDLLEITIVGMEQDLPENEEMKENWQNIMNDFVRNTWNQLRLSPVYINTVTTVYRSQERLTEEEHLDDRKLESSSFPLKIYYSQTIVYGIRDPEESEEGPQTIGNENVPFIEQLFLLPFDLNEAQYTHKLGELVSSSRILLVTSVMVIQPPTQSPSVQPSEFPTLTPSVAPSMTPSEMPSENPTNPAFQPGQLLSNGRTEEESRTIIIVTVVMSACLIGAAGYIVYLLRKEKITEENRQRFMMMTPQTVPPHYYPHQHFNYSYSPQQFTAGGMPPQPQQQIPPPYYINPSTAVPMTWTGATQVPQPQPEPQQSATANARQRQQFATTSTVPPSESVARSSSGSSGGVRSSSASQLPGTFSEGRPNRGGILSLPQALFGRNTTQQQQSQQIRDPQQDQQRIPQENQRAASQPAQQRPALPQQLPPRSSLAQRSSFTRESSSQSQQQPPQTHRQTQGQQVIAGPNLAVIEPSIVGSDNHDRESTTSSHQDNDNTNGASRQRASSRGSTSEDPARFFGLSGFQMQVQDLDD